MGLFDDILAKKNPTSAIPSREETPSIAPAEAQSPGLFDDILARKAEERTVAGTVKDVGITAAKGFMGLTEAAVGLADIPTGGRVGQFMEEEVGFRPNDAREVLDTYYSPAQQKANQAVEQAGKDKEGLPKFVDKTVAALENPSTIGHAVVESLPLMVGGGRIGQGVVKGAAAITGRESLKAAAKKGLAGAVIGEGLVGAGSAAESIRQENEDGSLSGKQALAAIGSGLGTSLFTVLGGKIQSKLGIGDIDALAAGGNLPAQDAKKGFMRRIIEGGFSEGVLEEMPQSIQEQLWQNYATDRPLLEGVEGAASMGMLSGAAMGGPIAAIPGREAATTPPAPAGTNTPPASTNPSPAPLGENPTTDIDLTGEATPLTAITPRTYTGPVGGEAPNIAYPSTPVSMVEGSEPLLIAGDEQGALPAPAERLGLPSPSAIPLAGPFPMPSPTGSRIYGSQDDVQAGLEPGGSPTPPAQAATQSEESAAPEGATVIPPRTPVQPTYRVDPSVPYPGSGKIKTPQAAPSPVQDYEEAQIVSDIDKAAHETSTSKLNNLPVPTQGNKDAGNYKKGEIKLLGRTVKFENPQGSERTWKDEDGNEGVTTLKSHYGYIRGVFGADKDHLDIFVKPGASTAQVNSLPVFVVDQINPKTKAFDEHKVLAGLTTKAEARATYLLNYDQTGETRIGAITELTPEQFNRWLDKSKTKRAAIAYKPNATAIPEKGEVNGGLTAEGVPGVQPGGVQEQSSVSTLRGEADQGEVGGGDLNGQLQGQGRSQQVASTTPATDSAPLPTEGAIPARGQEVATSAQPATVGTTFEHQGISYRIDAIGDTIDAEDLDSGAVESWTPEEFQQQTGLTVASARSPQPIEPAIPTRDEAPAEAKAEPEQTKRTDGKPFHNEASAKKSMRARGQAETHQIVPVKDGFAIEPKPPENDEAEGLPSMDDFDAMFAETTGEKTTPAEVVAEAVEVAREEGTSLKEQKSDLLKNLDAAIASAPNHSKSLLDRLAKVLADMNFEKKKSETYEERDERVAKAKPEYDKIKAEIGTVTIRVPDDGTFTVLNTKAALTQFRKQVESQFPTKGKESAKTSSDLPKASPPKAVGREKVNVFKTSKGAWHTDRRLVIKGKPIIAPKSTSTEIQESFDGDTESGGDHLLNRLTSMVKGRNEGTDIEFVARGQESIKKGTTGFEGVSPSPIKTTGDEVAFARIYNGDKEVLLSQSDYLYIRAHYPNAKIIFGDEVGNPVLFQQKGETVAIVSSVPPSGEIPTLRLEERNPIGAPEKASRPKSQSNTQSQKTTPPPKVDHAARAKEQAGIALKESAAAIRGILKNATNPNRLGSGPVFDDELYQQIRPHLQAAWIAAKAAYGETRAAVADFIKNIVEAVGAEVQPFARKYYGEILDGTAESGTIESRESAQGEEQDNDEAGVSPESTEALDEVSAGKGQRAKSGGKARSGGNGRSKTRSSGNRKSGKSGVSTTRSGGGSTSDVHSPEAGDRGGIDSIPASNYKITPDVKLGQGSELVKFNDNLAAIEILNTLERENRRATAEEQKSLARYVGWGGLSNAFADDKGEFKDGWEERGKRLAAAMSDDELKAARRSTRNAHYTSETIVRAMWDAVERMGFKQGLALEPSSGTGNFLGMMPESVRANFVAIEYDNTTARIAQALYPQSTVLHSGFQNVPLPEGAFDLAIGNPPFGDESLHFQHKPELKGKSIHNQFFLASLDALKPGGVQAFVVSRYLMDAKDNSTRLALAARGRLLGAIRLPDTAFKENARTEVVTDIIFLQKHDEFTRQEMEKAIEAYTSRPNTKDRNKEYERQSLAEQVPDWVKVRDMADPLGGEAMTINDYFHKNPQMIVGTLERSGSMRYSNDVTVRLDKSEDFAARLDQAMKNLPEQIMPEPQILEAIDKRFKDLSGSLQIALEGLEPGAIVIEKDGTLVEVTERETPEGDYELLKRPLTPESPWSDSLFMDAKGQWYAVEVLTDAEGKAIKKVVDGKQTRLNETKRVVYDSLSDVPSSKLLGQSRYERLVKLVKLRDLLKKQIVLETSDAPAKEMESNRKALNKAYDQFVADHDFINSPKNANLVSDMPDGALIQALEVSYRPEISAKKAASIGETARKAEATKAPILSSRVVVPYVPPGTASSPADALVISMAESGKVDLDRIAGLLNTDKDGVIDQLHNQMDNPLIFNDPETNEWQNRDKYLTGQVVRKLNAAKAAGLSKNIDALEKVIPEPWTTDKVTAVLGSTWIPSAVYADFIAHLTGEPGSVRFLRATNSFTINAPETPKGGAWRTEHATLQYLLTQTLNSTAIRISYTDSDGKNVFMPNETVLAQMKAKEIEAAFGDWVFADADRRQALTALFNEKFNTRVPRQNDGSHLFLPGKVPDIILTMRRHQKNAIWRGIQDRFMLLDHVVGAGKTFTAIARAMERRRMGIARKPMVVVPNHMVEQFAADVYRLYPGAKMLAAGKKDFERSNRRRLFAKIATGDWDIVVVPHSSFKFISISQEAETRYLEEEIRIAQAAVEEAWEQAREEGLDDGWRTPYNVKQAVALEEKLRARMDSIKAKKVDKLLTFEQLGVDDLTVDEAHEFKNLFYSSRMTGVKGMGDRSGSEKAYDLYQKVRVLRDSPTGSVTFMTGTPISNSAVEMYTMMRYLAGDELREMGLEHFDAWRAQFVDAKTDWEPTETGSLKQVNRLGRTWSNMRSLMDLYYSFTDAVTLDDIKQWYREDNDGKDFPVPKVKGGDRAKVVVKPTPAQDALLKEVIAGFESLDGMVDPNERNARRLRLMNVARSISLDARAIGRLKLHEAGIDPDIVGETSEAGGKIEKVTSETFRLYQQWNKEKGTQLIFLDRSVPKAKGDDKIIKEYDALQERKTAALQKGDEDGVRKALEDLEKFNAAEIEELRAAQNGGWNAYEQIKKNLVALGVPAKEIRFIQEANTDEQKQAMFDAVNAGEIRILLGSTPRMGAGTNVQARLVGLHHVDVTWKPSDIEQREGRIIRQGNLFATPPSKKNPNPLYRDNFEVEILAYATERTIDAKMWDLNGTKLKTINGIRKYNGEFTMDFEDEESVSMAEIAALASGDPLLLERVKLSSEIDRLNMLKTAWNRRLFSIKDRIADAEKDIARLPKQIENSMADVDYFRDALAEVEQEAFDRKGTVAGKVYHTKEAATIAAVNEVTRQRDGNEKARYALEINGEQITSKDALEGALDKMFGDVNAFAMEVGKESHNQRGTAAKEIAAIANTLGEKIDRKDRSTTTQSKRIGQWFGMSLDLDVDFSFGYNATLSLVDDQGRTSVSYRSNIGNKEEGQKIVSSQFIRGMIQQMEKEIADIATGADLRYLQSRLKRAEETLPVAREELSKNDVFPQADELEAKRDRLEEVIRSLSEGVQVENAEEGVNVALSVPSRAVKGINPVLLSGIAKSAKLNDGWTVRVVSTPTELPANVRAEMDRQGIIQVEGVKDGDSKTIFLVANGLESMTRAKQVLAHETFHAGVIEAELRGYLGSLSAAKIDKFKQDNPAYAKSSDLVIANEMLAQEAENNLWLKRIIGKINAWLKSVGINLQIGKADVYTLIDKALTRATAQAQGEMAVNFAAAWHGSPHKFDKFSTSAIGTGEGAQAFGWGLYFAGKKEVAEWYRNKLAGFDPTRVMFMGEEYGYIGEDKRKLMSALVAAGESKLTAVGVVDALQSFNGLDGALGEYEWIPEGEPDLTEEQNKILGALRLLDPAPQKGSLYQVELAPEEDEYLRWDKPLSEQSEKVYRIIMDNWRSLHPGVQSLIPRDIEESFGEKGKTTGEGFYKHLAFYNGQSDKAASEYLHSLGIRGIKYPAESGGRDESKGFNYVVFSEDDVEVTAQFSVNKKAQGLGRQLKEMVDDLKDSPYDTTNGKPIELAGGFNGQDNGADLSRIREEAARRDGERQLFEAVGYGNTSVSLGEDIKRIAESIAKKEVSREDALALFTKSVNKVAMTTPNGTQILRDIKAHLQTLGYQIEGDSKQQMAAVFNGLGRAYQSYTSPNGPNGGKTVEFSVPFQQITSRPEYKRASAQIKNTVDYLRMKFQDKFIPLLRVQEMLQGQGWTKTEANDAYRAEELFSGKATERLESFYKDQAEPLMAEIAAATVSLEEVESYLYAVYAPERNAYIASINPEMQDGGSGMTNKEAEKILADFTTAGKTPELERLAQKVRAISTLQREIIREEGLETDDTMDSWEILNPNYVPLKGGKDDQGKGIGTGYNVRRSGTKRALGRRSRAENILSELFAQVGSTIVRAEKVKVSRAFLAMAEENPDPSLWKLHDPKNKKTMPMKRQLGDNPVHKRLKRKIARRVYLLNNGNLTERRAEKIKFEILDMQAQLAMEPPQIVRDVLDMSAMNNENMLTVTREDGSLMYVEILDDDLARVMKNLTPHQYGPVTQFLAGITRYLSKMSTSLNPEFVVTNFTRDIQTAMVNIGGEHGAKAAKETAKGVAAAMAGIRSSLRGDGSHPMAAWFDRYRKAGAQVSFMDLRGTEEWTSQLSALGERGRLDGTRKVINSIGKFINDYNSTVENATRLSAFKAAIEAGMSESDAASLAKNLTVNFNRKGELGPAMNALYMFANAGVQGSARILGALKHKNVRRSMYASMIIAMGLAEAARAMGGAGDDGEDKWDKVTDYTKQTNLIFMREDGTIFKIRLPYGYNVFAAFGYALSDFMHGSKTAAETAKFMASATMNAFNPLGGDDNLLKIISPTLVDPLVEIATNENFMGQPIQPENYKYGPQKPDSELYFRSASEISKDVAQWINEATGGSKWEEGAVSISPETFDHLASFFTGGLGRSAARLVDVPVKIANNDVTVSDVPFVRQVVQSMNPRIDTDLFYQHTEKITNMAQTYKELPPAERSAFARKHPEIRLQTAANAYRKTLSLLRKQMNVAQDRNDRAAVKRIEEKMQRIAAQFNKVYNQRKVT